MTFPNRNQAGSGGYARSLLKALAAQPNLELSQISAPTDSGFAGTVTWLLHGAGDRIRAKPPSLVHCPSFVVPWRIPVPFVVTVFDISTRLFPADYPPDWRAYERVVVPRRARRASAVIAISELTRQDA